MASKTVSIGTDGNKEPSIDLIRKFNNITADQVTFMILTINAELKQNSAKGCSRHSIEHITLAPGTLFV
jgi:hypothetical protein